jgi:hypothetical protein
MKAIILTIILFSFTLIEILPQKVGDAARLHINNINIPFNRSGIIADVNFLPGGTMGWFEESHFLFSAGFMLSGYSNDTLWANAVASASLIEDYIPGTVEFGQNDPRAQLYKLGSQDTAFSQSWQDWSDAVALGADFYDGDEDGIYNPVDLNGNNQWDPNEDAPDLLGDETFWCVYNDGTPASQRRWSDVNPLGIEIRQTMFAYNTVDPQTLGNIILIRYKIKYVGLGGGSEPDKLDSVYFSSWADVDIGESYTTDLTGCDTLLNAGFTYKEGSDPDGYGNNPPSFFDNILSGAVEYILGVTFIDNNSNGIYDEGIDTPIDTAYTMKGQRIGEVLFPGARNQLMSSYVENYNSIGSPIFSEPDNPIRARYYMLGLCGTGEQLNPCDTLVGEVRGGIDCSMVNPRYWFSGDPVTDYGWIGTMPWDIRQLSNTGFFTLNKNEEKEVFVAYVVGRGTDHLNSITKAREISQEARILYASNFDTLTVVSVEDNFAENIPDGFLLYQNYPNPFNPVTNIQYAIGSRQFLTLRVYDILGREIATLVNEKKPAGSYEVNFDASSLSSGIYFYQLKAGNYISTKKMILMK